MLKRENFECTLSAFFSPNPCQKSLKQPHRDQMKKLKKEKFLEGICHKFRNFKALERIEFLGILEGVL